MDLAKIKNKIEDYCVKYYGDNVVDKRNSIYHMIPFLEFCETHLYEDRAKMIFEGRHFTDKRVLDLGCSFGIFSYLFAQRGAIVKGIESGEEKVEIVNDVAYAYELPLVAEVHKIDLDFLRNYDKEVDIIVFMNVLHHMTDEAHYKDLTFAMDVLKELKRIGKVIYFQTGFRAFMNNNEDIEEMFRNTGLQVTNLGIDSFERVLLKGVKI